LEGRGLRDGAAYWRIDGGEVPYWRFEGGGAPATDGERLFNVAKGPEGDVFLARRDPRTLAIASRTEFEWAGEVIHPPTVAGDRTFLTRFESVICFATDRDEVLWRGPTMDGISGAPTVHDDTVLVATGGFTGVDPQLRAFATEDGEQLWRYDGGTDAGTPAVADGTAFVGGSDGVHAVDLATGERRFRAPDVTDDLAAPIVADGTVVSTYDLLGMVVALSADDGTVLWRHAAETDRPPVVAEGEVYVDTGTEEGTVALDLEDGSVRRTFDGGGAPVARVGDVLYTASNGVLRALDVDGSHLWTHATERVQVDDMIGQGISGVTPVDGAVYVAARDGLHGIGPRPD
jgi:outer membrane protein assembly factor BamB